MGKKHSRIRHGLSRSLDDQRAISNSKSADAGSISNIRWSVLIGLLLIVVTFAAYWQVLDCGFLEGYDDHYYVTRNPLLAQGLGLSGFESAFTTFQAANWHPLTWISHMVDYRLYELDPMGHHLTNLIFHIINALLLFAVLRRMTGELWKSGLVAALFALHPLHVESVAWVSERKDVLSTFFWLTTMLAYVYYSVSPNIKRYLLVLVSFALGLLAKPMLVTLPFILLLLDYWPLRRIGVVGGESPWATAVRRTARAVPDKSPTDSAPTKDEALLSAFHFPLSTILEKLPLFVLSAASCVMTIIAQRSAGAVAGLDALPLGLRASNAAVSYVAYIVKMVWPSGLSVFYPYPLKGLQIWEGIGATILLTAVTVLALRVGKKYRYVTVGWLWYLISLVPVIGLVQVGAQAMADRYTYITLTGLFIAITWGVPDIIIRYGQQNHKKRSLELSQQWRSRLTAAAVVIIATLTICTWHQVEPWQDTNSLFRHALAVNPNNHLAYGALGKELNDQGEFEEAIEYLTKAIELHPSDATAHVNLGSALVKQGKIDEAFKNLRRAQELGLDVAEIHHNLAFGYFRMNKYDLATEECNKALQLDPNLAPSHNLLGAILGAEGKLDEAIFHWETAAELNPNYANPHSNLALAYYNKGDYEAAWKEIHILKKNGWNPKPGLFEQLSMRMPDPGE